MRTHRYPTRSVARPAETGLERNLVSDCCARAEAMGAILEVCGQKNARGSGTTVGTADARLVASGYDIAVEFKRLGRIASEDGQLSLAQRALIYGRLQQGVPTAVIFTIDEFTELVNWCRRNARPRWTIPFRGEP